MTTIYADTKAPSGHAFRRFTEEGFIHLGRADRQGSTLCYRLTEAAADCRIYLGEELCSKCERIATKAAIWPLAVNDPAAQPLTSSALEALIQAQTRLMIAQGAIPAGDSFREEIAEILTLITRLGLANEARLEAKKGN